MAVYVIGIDGGTESIRAGVFDLAGHPLGFVATPYATVHEQPGWAEQSPQDWWDAMGTSVRGVLEKTGICPTSVKGIALDTTCCSVVALDAAGDALMPCLLWMDMRSAEQTKQVLATQDDALAVNSNGKGPVSAEWMIPKALWIKQNRPQLFSQAAYVCEYQDYLNFHLTGRMCASLNNVSVRWHYAAHKADPADRWPRTLLHKLGMPELLSKWPQEVLELGETVGGLTAAAAAHLGLPAGVPVAQGGADAFVGMLGLGVVSPNQLALITGSSHLLLGLATERFHGEGLFGTYADALLPGTHVVEGGQTSTGSVVNWFKKLLGSPEGFYEEMNREAAAVSPGCEGLVTLDHFQGNRTPFTDPLSRGVLSGLTLKHGRAHVFRSILEGVAFGTHLILQTMRANGFAPAEVVIAGGATASPLWVQIHADVAGLPFRLTRCTDAPALGSAILAAVAGGCFADVRSAVAAMVHVERTVQPDMAAHAQYQPFFHAYTRTYPALKPVLHQQGAGSAPSRPLAAPAAAGVLQPRVAPSLLAADQAALGADCKRMQQEGADWLHVDIMDGHFVPNLTIGPPVVLHLRKHTDMFLDCHLSCSHPESLVDDLAAGGASSVTFHWEATDNAAALAQRIRDKRMRAACALKPATPADVLFPLLDAGALDMVLVLSVEPGFGGQSFKPEVLPKVRALRERYPTLDIQMDGGINPTTVVQAAQAGANVLVAGSAVFGSDTPGAVICLLRDAMAVEIGKRG